VQVDNKVYVDDRLLSLIESFDYNDSAQGGKSLMDSSTPPNLHTLEGIYVNARLTPLVPLADYRAAALTDSAVIKLCSAEQGTVPIEFAGVRNVFQCGAEFSKEPAALKIKILDRPTHCPGVAETIVGCESNDLNVELNAHDYTFVEHKTAEPIFGRGGNAADLRIVILHETGHWAGIRGHLTSVKNIMSEYLDECVCIDQAVIEQLNGSTQSSNTQSLALLNTRATLNKATH
jgi:hypothetical protein